MLTMITARLRLQQLGMTRELIGAHLRKQLRRCCQERESGPHLGAIYDVVVFNREDSLAPIKDAAPTDLADVFVHPVRCDFGRMLTFFVVFQQFSRIEREAWPLILRDVMSEQLSHGGKVD